VRKQNNEKVEFAESLTALRVLYHLDIFRFKKYTETMTNEEKFDFWLDHAMVIDAQTLDNGLKQYVMDVRQKIPVDKAYLFGSYSKGTAHEWSDVDVCVFSPCFEGKHNVDTTAELLKIAHRYLPEICFEPRLFPGSELDNDNPFVKEVLRTGREIKII